MSKQLDIVMFDIETTGLKADFSVILCATIKAFGQEPVVFRNDQLNKKWRTRRNDDKAITKAIRDELSKHGIVVTHNGSRFDIPYMKAKLARHDLEPLLPMLHIDTLRIARQNLQVSSRRLDNLGKWLLGKEKSRVEGPTWMEAGMNGDIPAMEEIVKHNIVDCELLEEVLQRLWPLLRQIQRI